MSVGMRRSGVGVSLSSFSAQRQRGHPVLLVKSPAPMLMSTPMRVQMSTPMMMTITLRMMFTAIMKQDRQDVKVVVAVAPFGRALRWQSSRCLAGANVHRRAVALPAPTFIVVPSTTSMHVFEGFPIDVTTKDGKPRIRDIDLALHLEFSRPRKIRDVAKGMPAELGIVELRPGRVRSQGLDGIVREMPVEEGWYTAERSPRKSHFILNFRVTVHV